MTKQILDLIEDISFNFNEDDSIILKTYIQQLEAQEIRKSCSNCKHSSNVCIEKSINAYDNSRYYTWNCNATPFINWYMEGEKDFKSFHCSLWVDVFEKAQQ